MTDKVEDVATARGLSSQIKTPMSAAATSAHAAAQQRARRRRSRAAPYMERIVTPLSNARAVASLGRPAAPAPDTSTLPGCAPPSRESSSHQFEAVSGGSALGRAAERTPIAD